jgi:hypothetical protein
LQGQGGVSERWQEVKSFNYMDLAS